MSVHIVRLGLLYSTYEYNFGHPEHTRSCLILEPKWDVACLALAHRPPGNCAVSLGAAVGRLLVGKFDPHFLRSVPQDAELLVIPVHP